MRHWKEEGSTVRRNVLDFNVNLAHSADSDTCKRLPWRPEAGETEDRGNADPGCYKYEVLNDGKTLLDPEIEIRGPKG